MYNIPLFDLNYDNREVECAVETIRSGWISTGAKTIAFEEKFAQMLGCKYACAVTNCTAALHLSCILAGVGPGDEVLCPSLTFAATVNCIRYVGAVPVFVDIGGSKNLCIDPNLIEGMITPKTKAIITMHFAGYPCEMDKIISVARKHNLAVIEDACHGPLSEYNGKKLGTIGDIGCFSFFSNKNISTGEGGMLVTDNEEVYNRAKLLRSHGMTTMSYQRASGHATNYDIVELGYNYRLDDIRASIGLAQLDKLPKDLEKRETVRNWYREELSECEGIIIPFLDCNEFVSNYIFPIVLVDSDSNYRESVRDYLKKHGIQTSVHYPAVHRFSSYKKFATSLPNTDYVTDNEITLPMYAKLQKDQIEYICATLKDALNQK